MKVKRFYEPIFFADVLLVTDCDLDDLNKWLIKKGFPTGQDDKKFSAYSTIFEMGLRGGSVQTIYFVWVSDKKDFYALLHETNHLTQKIISDRGIPYNPENTEVIAYLQDFWFKKLWRFMSKK